MTNFIVEPLMQYEKEKWYYLSVKTEMSPRTMAQAEELLKINYPINATFKYPATIQYSKKYNFLISIKNLRFTSKPCSPYNDITEGPSQLNCIGGRVK